jgi:hypothetical protein
MLDADSHDDQSRGTMNRGERTNWLAIGMALSAVIALAGITFLATVGPRSIGGETEPDGVRVDWPERLSQSTATEIPVTVLGADGAPRSGATVRLGALDGAAGGRQEVAERAWNDQLNPLQTLQTNDRGRAWLTIPPYGELSDSSSTTLVLSAGDGWSQTTGYITYRRPEGTQLSLTADRPLYEPGQQIHLRGMVLERDTSRPVAEARGSGGAVAELKLTDPRGNLLHRANLSVDTHGIVSETLPLAADGPTGAYEATLTYDDQTTTRTLRVRPYDKPRFEVELEARRVTRPGGTLVEGVVSADYVYGEPVAGAAVAVEVESTDDQQVFGTQKGALGADGRHRFEIVLPAGDHNSARRVHAMVTEESGRRREASTRLAPPLEAWSVELLPAETTLFREGESNPGVLTVRNAAGRPVEGASVDVTVEQHDAAPFASVETDAEGRADFEWKPTDILGPVKEVRLEVEAPDGRRRSWVQSVPVAQDRHARIIPRTATPRAGQSLSFEIDLPSEAKRSALKDGPTLLAVHDGMIVGGTDLEPADSDGDRLTGSIALGRQARGLTHLIVGDDNLAFAGWTTLWVRGEGDGTVAIDVGDGPHRPGKSTSVELALDGVDDRPVTYGVWAVDEALYALHERTELPLPVLLRQRADDAEVAGRLLERLDGSDPQTSTLNAARANATFFAGRDTHVTTAQLKDHHLRSIDTNLSDLQQNYWLTIWFFLMTLGLLAVGVETTRHTLRTVETEDFSWVRLAIHLLGPPALGFLLLVTTEFIDFFFRLLPLLYLIATAIALVAGVFEAQVRDRSIAYWKWLGAKVLELGVVVLLANSFETVEHWLEHPSWMGSLYGVGLLIWGALSIIEMLTWQFVLADRRSNIARVSLGLLLSLPAIGFVMMTASSPPKAKFEKANRGVQGYVNFGEGAEATGGQASEPTRSRAAAKSTAPDRPAPRPESTERTAPREAPTDGPEATGAPEPADELTVRQAFPDTMLWRPSVTAEDGSAEIDLQLPDSVTTWRLQAVGHTADGEVGEGSARLEVRKPFFAEVDLPSELTAGDEVAVPVSLVDGRADADEPLTLSVDAETSGALELGPEVPATATPPTGGRTVVEIPVRATGHGDGSLTVRLRPTDGAGEAEIEGDAVRRQTVVRADGRRRSRVASGVLGDGWRAEIDVPDSAIAGTISGRADLLPGRAAVALDGVESMLNQPHGCFEQTTSTAYPNLMILEALDASGPNKWSGGAEAWRRLHRRSRKLVRQGYQKILSFQDDGGGFALYPGDTPSTRLTAYGVLQIAAIDEAIDEIDASKVLADGSAWLVDYQTADGNWPADGRADETMQTAMAIWALAEGPETAGRDRALERGARRLERLLARRPITAYHRALAANALLAADRNERARRLLDDLADRHVADGETVHWPSKGRTIMGAWKGRAAVTTTALVARAMIIADTHRDLVEEALGYLASTRSPGGGWGNTEATVWALDAVAQQSRATDDPIQVIFEAAGRSMVETRSGSDGEIRFIPGRSSVQTLRAPKLSDGPTTFRFKPDRTSRAITQATVDYVVPWESPAARQEGAYEVDIEVEKRSLAAGEPVSVGVHVTNTTDESTGNSIVRLPVPPGAWPRTDQLEQMVASNKLSRIERRPTHLVLYLAGIYPGERATFSYEIVPRISGDYRFPPVEAWRYYNPRPRAATAGPRLTVSSADR